MNRTTMESGLVTLAFIVGTLVSGAAIIPMLLLFHPGAEAGEPVMDLSEPDH